MTKMTGVKVFTLPDEQIAATNFLNEDGLEVIQKQVCPCPKECVILLYVEYEKTQEEVF
jgi:hypothetical protein